MRSRLSALLGLLAAATLPAAAQWHSGATLVCSDCHITHASLTHDSDGGTPSTSPAANGGWIGEAGPYPHELKAPPEQLCLLCHDGQPFAPDVMGVNANTSPTNGRSAGALNAVGGSAPFDAWRGHTIHSTATPPGFDPTRVGAVPNWYVPANGLECYHCHAHHGVPGSYRNLGPDALGAAAASARPTYALGASNDTAKDVWINVTGYTPNSGSPATFNPYYSGASVSFNRVDAIAGTTRSSNRIDIFCGTCHGAFHGGPGDDGIGASSAALAGFLRHPTSQAAIGASASQGHAEHSDLARYTAATTKVRVYASDRVGYADAAPGCLTCHRAHGNQNPFGLVFLARFATSVGEEGGYASGQTEAPGGYRVGYGNLCAQCHAQGDGNPATGAPVSIRRSR